MSKTKETALKLVKAPTVEEAKTLAEAPTGDCVSRKNLKKMAEELQAAVKPLTEENEALKKSLKDTQIKLDEVIQSHNTVLESIFKEKGKVEHMTNLFIQAVKQVPKKEAKPE